MTELLETLTTAIGPVMENRWLASGLILIASIIIAKIADRVLTGLIGVWARRTKSDLDDRFIELVHRPIFVSVVLIGLGAITLRLDLPANVTRVTIAMLKTVAVMVWLGFGFRASGVLFTALSSLRDRFEFIQESTVPLFETAAKFLMLGAAVYAICIAWDANVTAWLASAGIAGLALSFAAQDSLANLFAGVFILADAPYRVGDFVVLDSGERGQVTRIGIRSTRLMTRDDVEITIPNSVMGNAKITNESGGPTPRSRIRVKVGVAYGTDLDLVERVLMGIARDHKEVCSHPEPRVRFRAFGESSLDLELLVWIEEPVDRGRMLHLLNLDVYRAFARERIEIPFPQRDLHVKQLPDASRAPAGLG